MIELKSIKQAKLKYDIKTRREEGKINGKKIKIEKEFNVDEILDIPFDKMNLALCNFVIRKTDFLTDENKDKKVYYGHVGLFGHFVAEDEILKWIKE